MPAVKSLKTLNKSAVQEQREEEIYKVNDTSSISSTTVSSSPEVLFKSLHQGTIIFRTSSSYIKFVGHIYRTSDKEIIKFLRSHPAFGSEIFEGEFPKEILDKFRRDKEFLRGFNIEEEDYLGLT